MYIAQRDKRAFTAVSQLMTAPRSSSTTIDPPRGTGLAWGGPARRPAQPRPTSLGVDDVRHQRLQFGRVGELFPDRLLGLAEALAIDLGGGNDLGAALDHRGLGVF